ncbi:hypothetical protein M8013_09020 [Enterobacteriaceae bacterium H4N4]|uniref:Uncharacterized protein n=1 Tax=Silvania confinis TaxID=2926470 RepID=A0A9J6QHV7_9ENTR|nr:hypothetical protein [Silvania confinis]MCU6668890.1 hypothetical protein [Silvania confinis]
MQLIHRLPLEQLCTVPATHPKQGDALLILSSGRTQFAKLMGQSLICDDGEAIEGVALEEVEVLGRVTYFITQIYDDRRVV